MNETLALLNNNPLAQAAAFLLALFVVWILLRVLLRIAMRIFAFGCGLVLALGVLILIIHYMGIG
jgi:undecaprenyl pyrophosphate phosphatase UppP